MSEMEQTITIRIFICFLLVVLLGINTSAFSQTTENICICHNTCNMKFPVYFGKTVDTDTDSLILLIKPLLKKQYQQCMIDNSYVSGDTLILELKSIEQILEENDNYVISIQNYLFFPRFLSLKLIKKGKSFMAYKIVHGENYIFFSSRKKICVKMRTYCNKL